MDIARQRLANQRISETAFNQPADVVAWLGAVQAQDYAAAKWAIALRAHGLTNADLDRALADGVILRTHVMRPTWHFVVPKDIRWLLALTAPRIHAVNAYQYRQLELDRTIFNRSNTVLSNALRGGRQLTRAELGAVLQGAGIAASGLRLAYIILGAELDGVICSGGRRVKQFTYALLDDRVPAIKPMDRNQALAELTRRYFSSHGPATEQDFMWWSGLNRADVQRGLEMVQDQLANEKLDGKTYWFSASMPSALNNAQVACLLPNYDEYVVGYADRSAIFDSSHADGLDARHNPLFQHTIVVKGQIAGTWSRTLKTDTVIVETCPFSRLGKDENRALGRAAQQYAQFHELPGVLK